MNEVDLLQNEVSSNNHNASLNRACEAISVGVAVGMGLITVKSAIEGDDAATLLCALISGSNAAISRYTAGIANRHEQLSAQLQSEILKQKD